MNVLMVKVIKSGTFDQNRKIHLGQNIIEQKNWKIGSESRSESGSEQSPGVECADGQGFILARG